jgi:hypothetical protein
MAEIDLTKFLDRAHETKALKEILQLPTSATLISASVADPRAAACTICWVPPVRKWNTIRMVFCMGVWPEWRAINLLLDQLRLDILAEDGTVEEFNGLAGQTVMGSQVHLIPLRRGEVNQPRGGIWAVMAGKASY